MTFFQKELRDSWQLVGRDFKVFNTSGVLWIFPVTYNFLAYSIALESESPSKAAIVIPASVRYTCAEPSGLRSSTVCFPGLSVNLFLCWGLTFIARLSMPTHPRGTLISALRLQSLQQTFVGASWWGTKPKIRGMQGYSQMLVNDGAYLHQPGVIPFQLLQGD